MSESPQEESALNPIDDFVLATIEKLIEQCEDGQISQEVLEALKENSLKRYRQ